MSDDAFYDFAARIKATGFITDPWLDGKPRFGATPVVLTAQQHRLLCRTGEDLALVFDEAVRLLLDDPAQRKEFLGLTPVQDLMFQHAGGHWHGLARADVFFVDDGVQVTELNCDTPTGEPEAIVLGRLGQADHPELVDACAALPARLAALWRASLSALTSTASTATSTAPTAAIVYPTELTEDLSLVRLYQRLLTELGFQVVLGSPYNLESDDDGGLRLFDRRVNLLLRHYKCDWWSERQTVWRDDRIEDTAPLVAPLNAVLAAVEAGTVAVVNPFGAVAAQNKRLMAFCWERIHRFSTRAQEIIEAILPYTARLETLHDAQLRADRNNWVIKSAYGAEGDEVIIGRLVTDAIWDETLRLAKREHFVAQRYFEAKRGADGVVDNYGVFVVAGEACGVYTRKDRGLTDPTALSVPTLVQRP
jgi:glutathionylspermidine synthase